MVASAVLAQSDRLGNAAFLAIGPAVIFVALIGWVTVVLMTSRKRRHYPSADDGLSHRGPVMGGVILGSPSQRTRRDPAPSVTHREATAHVEQARAEEAERLRADGAPARRGERGRAETAAEPSAQAPPLSEDLARPARDAAGSRGRHRGRDGAARRRRFGLPRLR